MTTFDYAVGFTLDNEGTLSNDPHDHGGLTKYGLTVPDLETYQRKFHALLGKRLTDLTRDDAIGIYRALYWRYDSLRSQRIATKLFDIGVHCGLTAAVLIAQRSLLFIGAVGPGILLDGLWGPQTRDLLNAASIDPAQRLRLFKAMCFYAGSYYVDIVARDHSQLDFIDGWLARAARRPLDLFA